MLSAELIQIPREDHAEADNNLYQIIVCNFECLLFSVSCISLAQLLTIYINYALCQSSTRCPRERENSSKYASVYLSKIENSS